MSKQSNLLDMPDEILLLIFKQLNTIDVLYLIANVNQRLNSIAHDFLLTRQLDLTGLSTIKDRCNEYLTDEHVSSHLRQNILSRIHHQIHRLTIEPSSMKDMIAVANYPQLYSVTLRNFQEENLHQYFTDDWIQQRLYKQLRHLYVDVNTEQVWPNDKILSQTFASILSLCDQLNELEFKEYISENMTFTPQLHFLQINFLSTTLTKLKLTVACFYDCLYLLDGRLESLSILIIHVGQIFNSVLNIGHKKKLPKLKIFSLTSFTLSEDFDNLIVPLIRRMVNLEQLKLYLTIVRYYDGYLDGIQLSNLILNHLKQLESFIFDIETNATNFSDHPLPTNEVVQQSFNGKHYSEVISVVYDGYTTDDSTCRIYSIPYDFNYFHNLNNSFSGGLFDKVRFVTMKDDHPFENDLFRLLSRDMPFLKQLEIWNGSPQKHKDHSSTILTFLHLERLDVQYAHDDYVELFLLKMKSCLPRLSSIRIDDQSVQRLQIFFNNDSSQFNIDNLFNRFN